MTEEQLNVALLALLEQRQVWRDEDGNFRREDRDPATIRLSLQNMFARKDADYRRLQAVVAYCNDPVCHRACLLTYFDERLPPNHRCGNCSACSVATAQAGRPGRVRTFKATGARSKEEPKRASAGVGADRARMADTHKGDSSFWRSKDRAFTVDELRKRTVPRKVGLSVLGIVAEAEGKLSPSGIANVLKGSRTCDAVQADPELLHSIHFGAEKEKRYEQVLPDVLAMHAKGYLGRLTEKSKKLVLTAKGRAILGIR